jgi:hypothetical protein
VSKEEVKIQIHKESHACQYMGRSNVTESDNQLESINKNPVSVISNSKIKLLRSLIGDTKPRSMPDNQWPSKNNINKE